MRLGEKEPGEHIALKFLTHFVEKNLSVFITSDSYLVFKILDLEISSEFVANFAQI